MSWLQKKRSPRPSSSPNPGLVSSGSPGPPEVRLHCDEGGLKNPMDWGNMPTSLQQKFPHWKENLSEGKPRSQSSTTDMDRSIHFSSSFKAPDHTIPYMVMDRDTLNSIAIKFETTPSEIARINRKRQGPSFVIFPGDVIYVPDIENMPKSSPPPPSPPSTPPSTSPRERGVTPLNWATDVEEEMTDSHVKIVCKFMSDDQGCIHGTLTLNHMSLMFTPHTMDPLVMELGAVRFEIILPISDISYAALTKDVTPPTRHSNGESESSSEIPVVISSTELDLSLDKITVGDDIPTITFTKANGKEEIKELIEERTEITTPLQEKDEKVTPLDAIKDSEASITTLEGDPTENEEKPTESKEMATESEENPIKNEESPTESEEKPPESQEKQAESEEDKPPEKETCEDLLSDEAVFLHVHVIPRPGMTYTYTPINSTIGIDIPKGQQSARNSRSPSVQQVKTCFCFAFVLKRAQDIVQFIKTHHPKPLITPSLEAWIDGPYVFISSDRRGSNEDLDFCEDHFEASSWEIMSLQDLHKYRRRLSAMEDLDLPLPTLSEESQLLVEGHLKKLVVILPAAAVDRKWELVYSTFRDGISIRTLYRSMVAFENEDSPVVLVVRDDQDKIFGAVTTCPIRMSDKYYGRGESSLFSFDSPTEMHHYYWAGINHYFVKGNSTSLSIGAGDGHPGLWIDENFYHGSSYECSTFNNEVLASSQDFICTGVEAWCFL